MNPRKGRLLAWGSVAVGTVVLLACTVAFKDRIAEKWWLHKLESGEREDQKVAAERLADMGSVRAVPVLLHRLREIVGDDSREQGLDIVLLGTFDGYPVTGIKTNDFRGLMPVDATIIHDVAVPVDGTFLIEALWKITVISGRTCTAHWAEALRDEDQQTRFLARTFLDALDKVRNDESE
jgi:hypothetical protein